MDIKEELKKYKEMLDEGLITQEDYDKLKNKVLEIETASVNSIENEDPFKAFREMNNPEPSENAIKNEAPKESKKTDIDTSWLHEEYLIPPSSGNNSTGFGSTGTNSTIGSPDSSIHTDNKPVKKKNNGFCIAGGSLGIIALFLINPFCIVAILGTIFSIIGLVDCRKKRQHGDAYAIIGVFLSGLAIVLFFLSLFTSFTLFGWMQGTNLPVGGKSNTSAIVATENTSSAEPERKTETSQQEQATSQQEPATTTVTLPDLTGNWRVDNCVFPDGTSIRGDRMTDVDIRFHGLTYVMNFSELNVTTGGDLNYIGSYNAGVPVYNSSQNGTDSVVYFDDVLYMKLSMRDDLNNDVMGYYVLVREGASGFGSLTTEDALAICTTMDSIIKEVRGV